MALFCISPLTAYAVCVSSPCAFQRQNCKELLIDSNTQTKLDYIFERELLINNSVHCKLLLNIKKQHKLQGSV